MVPACAGMTRRTRSSQGVNALVTDCRTLGLQVALPIPLPHPAIRAHRTAPYRRHAAAPSSCRTPRSPGPPAPGPRAKCGEIEHRHLGPPTQPNAPPSFRRGRLPCPARRTANSRRQPPDDRGARIHQHHVLVRRRIRVERLMRADGTPPRSAPPGPAPPNPRPPDPPRSRTPARHTACRRSAAPPPRRRTRPAAPAPRVSIAANAARNAATSMPMRLRLAAHQLDPQIGVQHAPGGQHRGSHRHHHPADAQLGRHRATRADRPPRRTPAAQSRADRRRAAPSLPARRPPCAC